MRLWPKKKTRYTKDILLGDIFEIGDFTYGKPEVFHFDNRTKLKIGKFCSIAGEVQIFLGGNHRIDWVTTFPFPSMVRWPEHLKIKGHPGTKGDVVIGSDVWIGQGAMILSGVTIGDGAVIGAKAVVSENVPSYGIVVGNPATVIKKRFDDDTIEKLLKIKWWDWPFEKIRQSVPLLCSHDLSGFIEFAESI